MSLCEQYEPYLAALADGEIAAIPREIRSQLEAHIQACRACQAQLARQRQVVRLVAGDDPPAVSAARWRQVWDAVGDRTTNRARGRLAAMFAGRGRWMAAGSCVAVAAMVLLAVLLAIRGLPIGTGAPSQPVQTYVFATQQDSEIESLETYGDDETAMVITSGQQDVVVVWMAQNEQKSHT
jgi:anti-sigma factor RsiW